MKKDRLIATAVLALKAYNPANSEFTSDKLREALKDLDAATVAEQKATEGASRARENAMKAEWDFHEQVLGVKRQVIAQYGDDSEEITALGFKKKSERKYGRPRKTAAS